MTAIHWLAATCLLTALFWPTYVLNRLVVRGLWGVVGNPDPEHKPLAAWAERARAAHTNAIENLAVFAPLVLAAQALGLGGGITLTASVVYFFARLAHFVVYTAGLPIVRTLAFTAAWLAQAVIALAILGVTA